MECCLRLFLYPTLDVRREPKAEEMVDHVLTKQERWSKLRIFCDDCVLDVEGAEGFLASSRVHWR